MKLLTATAAIFFASTSAYAVDSITYQEPALPAITDTFSWTGGYIGAHAGYGWGSTKDVYNNTDSPKKRMKGGFGGLQIGYNWQFDNNIVLGAEGDVSFGKINKNWSDMEEGTNAWSANSTYYTQDKIGTHGTVRGRLGYAAGRFLPYVTGGFAWADTKATLGCSGVKPIAAGNCKTQATQFETSESVVRVGYTVGAGLEYAVTDSWTVKAEYLYTDFGKKNVTLVDPNPRTESTRRLKNDLSEVRMGVNYKF